jgi:hypothetical protein
VSAAEWIGGLAGLAGLGGSAIALFKARPEARKIDAEAAATLSDSSAKFATTLVEQIDKQGRAIERLQERLAEQERKQRRQEDIQYQRLRLHERWDSDMADQVRRLGGDVSDPPPLYPDPTAA